MNGRSKSVVVTFVVAMAVGVVAEACQKGSGKAGRRIGQRRVHRSSSGTGAGTHRRVGKHILKRVACRYGHKTARRLLQDSAGKDKIKPRRLRHDSPGNDIYRRPAYPRGRGEAVAHWATGGHGAVRTGGLLDAAERRGGMGSCQRGWCARMTA